MNSSGIKRGLATTAVSALAVAGLPLLASSASAQPGSAFETGGAAAVTLVQPWTAANTSASAQNDGTDNTVRLTASAGADVSAVSFYYTIGNAAPVLIQTVQRNDNGFFAAEWAAAGLGGATVEIFAINGGSTPAQIGDLINQDGQAVDINNNEDALEVADGDAKGVFQAPYDVDNNAADTDQYVIFNGTASAGFAVADLNASWLTGTADASNPGVTQRTPVYAANALVTGSKILTSPANQAASAPETFAGVIDINGYTFGGASDDLFIHAVNTADNTDAGEAYTLYRQNITTVTAVADRTNVPNGQSATVTVTVADQNGNPIAGARVQSSNTAVTAGPGASDDAQITNARGQVTFTQTNGTAYFYADATDNAGFQDNLGDKRSQDIAVTQFVAAPTALEAVSENGLAFDVDEDDANAADQDIKVQIVDQAGNDFDQALRNVNYYWVVTPFDGTPATERFPATGTDTAVTNGDGEAQIVFPTATDVNGTYELYAGLAPDLLGNGAIAPAKVLTVKAGQAVVDFDGNNPLAAPAGGSIAVSGNLELPDGTGLPGREVELQYTGGTNAQFVLANGATTNTVTLTTGENGAFAATLKDPAVATGQTQPTETGTINATTNPVADDGGDLDDPVAAGTVGVSFFSATAPAGSKVTISGLAGSARPGEIQYGRAQVTNQDGSVSYANQAVTLTVDGDSFFTSGPVNGAAGQPAGDLASLGQEITLVTDAQGFVDFKVSVERSEEFDDDGLAEDIVTATISTGTDTEDVDYTSANPLNGGEVSVELAADRFQESGVLPQAPTTDDVAYNLEVTDQFGNKVRGANVTVTLAGGGSLVDGNGSGINSVVQSDTDEAPEFYISSNIEGDVTPTGSWTPNRSVYAADNTNVPNDADTDQDVVTAAAASALTDVGTTAEFYEVDFAESSFTLSQEGDDRVPVGTTVIMRYTAVDQNGEPIEFLVDFFRTGPVEQDGESNQPNVPTGEDGVASYVFAGTAAGTATVTAIGELGNEVIPESQVSDTVEFAGPVDERADIVVELDGKNNGKKADVLKVTTTPAAEGALATLFKVAKNGNRTPFRFKTLDNEGKVKFRANDKNGNRKTKYVVVVDETDTTKAGESNNKNVR